MSSPNAARSPDRMTCISPVDGEVYLERATATAQEVEAALIRAQQAQLEWQALQIEERAVLCNALVDAFQAQADRHALELAWQMGRPVCFGGGEINGFGERARSMIEQAGAALADIEPPPRAGFRRFIRRTPLGVLLTIAPWNYPYLTAVNSVIPGLMAGNAVLLKHSHQTPLCAERIIEAGLAGGLPAGLLQFLHLDRRQTTALVQDARIAGVSFTGSVAGGEQIERAAAGRFIPVGLELGGKDPAYVRADADVEAAAAGIADGAFFNSGQSCCGIERIYVHTSCYAAFTDALVGEARKLRLGNPLEPETTLGPMVRTAAAELVREQTAAALQQGARGLLDGQDFPAAREQSPYLAPQILVDVTHEMAVMRDESFGPVVGVMAVADDNEAVRLMNDSTLGLTASIWSRDVEVALRLGDAITAGTVFLNRCDYLDPELAWTGVRNSGRGCSLSTLGYGQLTQAKSFHFRLPE